MGGRSVRRKGVKRDPKIIRAARKYPMRRQSNRELCSRGTEFMLAICCFHKSACVSLEFIILVTPLELDLSFVY